LGVDYPDFSDLAGFQQQVQRPSDFSHISFECGPLGADHGLMCGSCYVGSHQTGTCILILDLRQLNIICFGIQLIAKVLFAFVLGVGPISAP
jgi:hypothetical protein